MLNIALPKGRLGQEVYARFAAVGLDCPALAAALQDKDRRLIFRDEARQVSYMLVKPSDVAVYVERGAADLGVVGKDVLQESRPDVYELLDLGLGCCRMCVAGRNNWREDPSLPLRVATKYPNTATEYFAAQNREIDVIKLHGSIELGPALGLSDVIVDVVQTGATLKENDLSVYQVIAPSSARLIANKSSYQFERESIDQLVSGLRAISPNINSKVDKSRGGDPREVAL